MSRQAVGSAFTDEACDLVDWPRDATRRLYSDPFVCSHRLQEFEMFSDASLATLIDRFPHERLEVATMVSGKAGWSDWHIVDYRGVSGTDLIAAIRRGSLWARLMRVDLVSQEIADLMRTAYAHILHLTPDLEIIWSQPSILISSARAQVYYHADAFPTMLWHIRGRKRVWTYPLNDETLVSQQALEEIIAGRCFQMAPYREEFDRRAGVFELPEGHLLCWPPHAPHRVENLSDLNVSLTFWYESSISLRRREIYMANRALRKYLRIRCPSTREEGAFPDLKRRAYRLARRLGMLKTGKLDPPTVAHYRIDPSSENGVAPLPGGVQLPFLGNRAIRAESAPYFN